MALRDLVSSRADIRVSRSHLQRSLHKVQGSLYSSAQFTSEFKRKKLTRAWKVRHRGEVVHALNGGVVVLLQVRQASRSPAAAEVALHLDRTLTLLVITRISSIVWVDGLIYHI